MYNESSRCYMEDKEYRKRLVEDNIGLAYLALKKFKLNSEEYFDVAAIGLCKAANTFDTSRGLAFSTYAMFVISNELKVVYRGLTNQKHIPEYAICSYNTEVLEDSDKTFIEYNVQSSQSIENDIVLKLVVQQVVDSLSAKEQCLFNLIMQGYTQYEVARYLNVSQSLVAKVMKKIRVKAKTYINC